MTFLRSKLTGKIINADRALVFEITKGSGSILSNGEMQARFAVTAVFDRATEYLSMHDTRDEAAHELDCLYEKLTGWSAVVDTITSLPIPTRRPMPDPFGDIETKEECEQAAQTIAFHEGTN